MKKVFFSVVMLAMAGTAIVGAQQNTPAETVYVTDYDAAPVYGDSPVGVFTFMAQNIKYPESAVEKGITGTVLVGVDIAEDGTVRAVKTEKGIDPALDAEGVRVISLIKKFKPAMKNGKPVACHYIVPIKYSL